jgi:nucleoside-diphosphate-sugar epimerase
MKILVTGASGFLGSALVERLLVHGEREIRCLVRDGTSGPKLSDLAGRFRDASLEIIRGDLSSKDDVETALEDVACVYHLAAAMKGSAADIFLNTVVASKNLLDALGPVGRIRVILTSSFGVYGTAALAHGAVLNENTALEREPARRDLYSHAKLRQELLFREYQERYGFPLVVVRPGVIYGRGSTGMSNRVGISVFGWFLHMGRDNVLPLTHVVNCAEALVVAARNGESNGDAYNVVDDDVPTAREFLRLYRQRVERIRYVSLPYPMTRALSTLVERYSRQSRGQLPAVLTPYKSACLWGGTLFDNGKLKAIGWKQVIATTEGLEAFFLWLQKNR